MAAQKAKEAGCQEAVFHRGDRVTECAHSLSLIHISNPQSVEDYRNGRAKAMGFLVGPTLKAMKGKADPSMVNQLVRELLAGGDV